MEALALAFTSEKSPFPGQAARVPAGTHTILICIWSHPPLCRIGGWEASK